MAVFTFENKEYTVDTEGFLVNSKDWDENFARGMAPKLGISNGLSEDQWKIINFIRGYFKRNGRRPSVYVTCQKNQLDLKGLKKLFPAGYLRGACKIAGITYKEGYLDQADLQELAERATIGEEDKKTYEIDVRGYLINPQAWDKKFATYKAKEMKMPRLTDKHWKVINFLRESFEKNNLVPTVYETCEATGIGLEEFQLLFPDGYHRGAVKVSGLRVR